MLENEIELMLPPPRILCVSAVADRGRKVEVERTGEDVCAEGVRVVAALRASTVHSHTISWGREIEHRVRYGGMGNRRTAPPIVVGGISSVQACMCRTAEIFWQFALCLWLGPTVCLSSNPSSLMLPCCFFRLHFGVGFVRTFFREFRESSVDFPLQLVEGLMAGRAGLAGHDSRAWKSIYWPRRSVCARRQPI